MARQIAPGKPITPEALKIPQTPVDVKIFTDLGDDLIKASNTNFELYAKLSWKTEADKAFKEFGNDPIALSNALGKLTQIMDGLPEDIQQKMMPQMYNDSVSMVQKARNNQRVLLDKQNKEGAQAMSVGLQNDMRQNFFNVLAYYATPEEERRDVDLDIYQSNRQNLVDLAGLTDSYGNFIFNDAQRKDLTNAKNPMIKGFNDFINRMELDTLKTWDKDFFQNQAEFMRRTGVDEETYQTMEKNLKSRLKALADNKDREIHGQAWYDAASLITSPIQANIDKAKEYDFADAKLIEAIANHSKETTKNEWYKPLQPTSPGAFMQAYVEFGDAVNNSDFSYEGRVKAGWSAAEALLRMNRLAKDTNMPPSMVNRLKATIQNGLTDPMAAAALQNIESMVPASRSSGLESVDALWGDEGRQITRGVLSSNLKKNKDRAAEAFDRNFAAASDYFLQGDYETFNRLLVEANKQYWKDLYGFMGITPDEWNRLESQYAAGQPAVQQWLGVDYTFQGFDNNGPRFKVLM